MTILEAQLQQLREDGFSGASAKQLPNGAAVISIPEVPLPSGWNHPSTTIRFVAPVGYPHAQPDCFWADHDLRLQSGAMPQATNVNSPLPGENQPLLWFSWHVSHWSPNRDTLLTYLNVIKKRLKDLR